jgi:hypothetical protein
MAKPAQRSTTERILDEFWEPNPHDKTGKIPSHREAAIEALALLADALGRGIPAGNGLRLHLAVLEGMTREQCVRAISRAAETSSFFPTPAQLVELSGRVEPSRDGDAMDALRTVIEAMRKHGPELKPIPGEVIRDKDDDGLVLVKPQRAPDTFHPGFSDRTEAAILNMGFGSRTAGLEAIAVHPALDGKPASADNRDAFRTKNAQEIEQRWIRAFTNDRGTVPARKEGKCR